jgi:hypothetical protein
MLYEEVRIDRGDYTTTKEMHKGTLLIEDSTDYSESEISSYNEDFIEEVDGKTIIDNSNHTRDEVEMERLTEESKYFKDALWKIIRPMLSKITFNFYD